MKLSTVFTVLNQIKIDHWQTKSHSEHVALGTAYEELGELFDSFVEIYYGKKGIPDVSQSSITYSIKSDSYKQDPINRYTTMRDSVLTYLSSITEGESDLKNIKDEIEGEFNQLIYRLQQS